jgi:hypothetical protein
MMSSVGESYVLMVQSSQPTLLQIFGILGGSNLRVQEDWRHEIQNGCYNAWRCYFNVPEFCFDCAFILASESWHDFEAARYLLSVSIDIEDLEGLLLTWACLAITLNQGLPPKSGLETSQRFRAGQLNHV